MEENKIPPRSEWKNMSIQQLYDVQLALTDKYYAMRNINASFTNQFMNFISEVEALISRKQAEELEEREKDSN